MSCDEIICHRCGASHSMSQCEPSFMVPDLYLTVPEGEREHRTLRGSDSVCVRDADDTWRRYFLRCLMPFGVEAGDECCWGVWVEVEADDYFLTRKLWDDPGQGVTPPFRGKLANAIRGYDDAVDAVGSVQLTSPPTPPTFRFPGGAMHRLAQQQRSGV